LFVWNLDWELSEKKMSGWDPRAEIHLLNFYKLRYRKLPKEKPYVQFVEHPTIGKADLADAVEHLKQAGFGWIKPEEIWAKLMEFAASPNLLDS
jgi:hypothetical protein